MRSLIVLVCLLVLTSFSPVAENKYPVSGIPSELLQGVNAVVRDHQVSYRILATNHAVYNEHIAVTILNDKASHHAYMQQVYDKLSKIKTFNGTLYDASGKVIRKLKTADIRDVSAFDGFSLYSDTRVKSADLSQSTFPYTVELEYEIDWKFLYAIPSYEPIPDEHTSVQLSVYSLQFPRELKPRYKCFNVKELPAEKSIDGFQALEWKFENQIPAKREIFSKEDPNPRVIAAPSKFEYDGYSGDMSTWDDFGKWSLTLNKGRDELTPATKEKVKQLTAGLKSNEEKVKVLYEYLQSKTRYVSIQEGIGGLQPFPAMTVDVNGYGDCKALSNYMVALLREAGIKGYYTRIKAGETAGDVITDFPSPQSNHVIVSVPNGSDTLWLECTSQTNAFGYQGTFTGNRKALMITENGGKLVNTLTYNYSQNSRLRSGDIVVDKTGSAKGKIKTQYAGLQSEHAGLSEVVEAGSENQKKWLLSDITIPSFDIKSWKMSSLKNKVPVASVEVDLQMNRLATVSGKRLFLSPNLLSRIDPIPAASEERKTKIFLRGCYTDIDTIRFRIPDELYPEFVPPSTKIDSRFGVYESSVKMDQGTLVYIRKMVRKNGTFPADSYSELVEFYKKISKADNIKLVFLNKT